MAFECVIERRGDHAVVVPEGDIDVATTAAMRQVLQQMVEGGDYRSVAVDMRGVTFLDSSGLGMLVAAHRAAAARGVSLQLREPGPMVRMVLEMTNLKTLLTGNTPDS